MNTMGWNSYWTRFFFAWNMKIQIDIIIALMTLYVTFPYWYVYTKKIHSFLHPGQEDILFSMNVQFVHTMNCQVLSSPNRRACLLKFSRFSFHPAHNFSCNNWKIPPLIYLVNKWARSMWHFFQPCLFIPVCSSIRDFRVEKQNTYYFAIRCT